MSARRPRLPLLVLTLFASLFGACSDGGGGGTGPDPAISISLAPGSLTLEQGDAGTLTVTLNRTGGFTGAVGVTASGLPAGVTVTPASIPAGGTQTTLAVAAATSATVGTSTITVTATGSGVSAATATASLEIEPAPVGTFTLGLSPSDLSLEQGESGTSTVQIDRSGGFQGTVNLAVSGAPAGLTATLGSNAVTGAQTSLQVQAAAGLAAGTYTLTVTGTGQGTDDRTAQLTVDVTAAPAETFELTMSPSSLSLQQGASGSSTVQIDRSGGFQGTVDLAVSGAPAGVTATLASNAVSGTQTTLDVQVGAGVATGSYTLTVTGSGTGTQDRTAQLALTVTQSTGGGGTEASWTFCTDVPIWFAVRDGTGGGWTRVQPTGGDTFEFQISSDEAGVAYVQDFGFGQTTLTVQLLGSGELNQLGASFCEQSGTKEVNFVVQGLGATDFASLSLGGSVASVFGAVANTGTFEDVPDGSVDLFGARSTLDQQTGEAMINRYFLDRGLTPADGGQVTVDFGGANAFDPVDRTATLSNLGTDMATLSIGYVTSGGASFVNVAGFGETSSATTRTIPLVPVDRQQASDLHSLFVVAVPDVQDPSFFRSSISFFDGAGDQQVALGPVLNLPTVTTASSAPYVQPRVQYARQATYDKYWSATFSQTDREVELFVTDDYLDGGAVDVTFPDLSAAAGWSDTWALAGGGFDVTFSALGWDTPGGLAPFDLQDGTEIQIGSWNGEVN